jgi:hypothetical protein
VPSTTLVLLPLEHRELPHLITFKAPAPFVYAITGYPSTPIVMDELSPVVPDESSVVAVLPLEHRELPHLVTLRS